MQDASVRAKYIGPQRSEEGVDGKHGKSLSVVISPSDNRTRTLYAAKMPAETGCCLAARCLSRADQ